MSKQLDEMKNQIDLCYKFIDNLNKKIIEMGKKEEGFLNSEACKKMETEIRYLKYILAFNKVELKKMEKNEKNPFGAGRKPMDQKQQKVIDIFSELMDSGKTREEIIDEMNIGQATYYRYKKVYDSKKNTK